MKTRIVLLASLLLPGAVALAQKDAGVDRRGMPGERRSGEERDAGAGRRESDSSPRVNVGAVSVRVPVTWRRSEKDGTVRFDAPAGDAYVLVDVAKVQRQGMEPRECRDKITESLGGTAWEMLSLGGYPAAHRSSIDVAKGAKETVRTHAFVGCDGSATWSMLFHLNDERAKQYEEAAVLIAKSLEYVDAPPPLAEDTLLLRAPGEAQRRSGRIENP
ncbi:MAG: hypothetical protein ACKVPX_18020 [Myxococcaceae bacterium]